MPKARPWNTFWSYSRLTCYEQCPALFKYRNIDKLEEPKGDAMWRGIKVHKEVADYLDGKVKMVPASGAAFTSQLEELKEMHPIVEEDWTFTQKMKMTGKFAPDAWLRLSLDAFLDYGDSHADIIDFKTGKFRPQSMDKYTDQLRLYAGVSVLRTGGKLETISTRLWFLDTGDEVVEEYTKQEALDYFDDIVARAEAMLAADRFPANPNALCGWCHFRRSNGGPCSYG